MLPLKNDVGWYKMIDYIPHTCIQVILRINWPFIYGPKITHLWTWFLKPLIIWPTNKYIQFFIFQLACSSEILLKDVENVYMFVHKQADKFENL